MPNWKRAVECASPLLLVPIVFLDHIQPFGIRFGWWLLSDPLSPYWVLLLTGTAWVTSIIVLRPLSAPSLSPRARFSFIAALAGAWLAAVFTIQTSRTPDTWGVYTKIDLLALLPAAILTWGIRERLSPVASTDASRCARCGYPRAGLAANAPCPECGPNAGASALR
ncbi:MAG: hypothetical protein K2Q09_00195 [Phycisphaerales bacterium]|nr:hypothetical protein [Phycisphaerales bacterium]